MFSNSYGMSFIKCMITESTINLNVLLNGHPSTSNPALNFVEIVFKLALTDFIFLPLG